MFFSRLVLLLSIQRMQHFRITAANNETYNQLINKWYIDLENIMKEKNLQYSILDFTEIIKPEFVYKI